MKRILVIDDDDLMRSMLSQMLERAGYEVIIAANGHEGIKQFYAHLPVDLVITDLIMPGKEGIETMMELRRDHPAVPVIAISGGARATGRDYLPIATQLGARQTVAKPFTRQEMLEAVEAALTL